MNQQSAQPAYGSPLAPPQLSMAIPPAQNTMAPPYGATAPHVPIQMTSPVVKAPILGPQMTAPIMGKQPMMPPNINIAPHARGAPLQPGAWIPVTEPDVMVGLGWDFTGSEQFDLDASVTALILY